jgi:hypothetical protein
MPHFFQEKARLVLPVAFASLATLVMLAVRVSGLTVLPFGVTFAPLWLSPLFVLIGYKLL